MFLLSLFWSAQDWIRPFDFVILSKNHIFSDNVVHLLCRWCNQGFMCIYSFWSAPTVSHLTLPVQKMNKTLSYFQSLCPLKSFLLTLYYPTYSSFGLYKTKVSKSWAQNLTALLYPCPEQEMGLGLISAPLNHPCAHLGPDPMSFCYSERTCWPKFTTPIQL